MLSLPLPKPAALVPAWRNTEHGVGGVVMEGQSHCQERESWCKNLRPAFCWLCDLWQVTSLLKGEYQLVC